MTTPKTDSGIINDSTTLDARTCTLKEATDYAQTLKRSIVDIGENDLAMLQGSGKEFLIAVLKLCHPSGDRIDPMTAEITIAHKPPECDRPGTSQTCYYIQPHAGSQFQPVWFADCRAGIRAERLKAAAELVTD